ncbi:MAG: PAS domain S-box protein, partial [Desulfobacterales bacterium]|nr:PAS domain S-box protein [Desulfobacterales bacterium]
QKRANSVLRTLYDISRAVNSTRGLDDLFELIHESLGAIMDAKNFFIGLYDEKADLLTFPYYIDEKDEAEPIFNASETNSLTTKVIFQNKALIFDEAEMRRMNESDEHEVMGAICKIWIGVPLSIKGKVIGAVALQSHTDPDLYTEKDIAVLESVSEQIAIAIDSKRTKEALSESEKRYRTLFDNAGDAILLHDMGREFLDVNAVARARYGYSREEFLKMSPGDLLASGQVGLVSKRVEKIRAMGRFMSETVHKSRDGAVIPSELNSRIIEYNGKPAVLSIARDLTERKLAEKEKQRMEVQLQNARKMEAIGLLAGGVAHDLNNILSGLVSYPELLLMDLPEESPLRDGILLIQNSGNKAAAIVQDLLTLARRGVVVSEVVDLNRIITDHMGSHEHRATRSHHPGIRVRTVLDPALPHIMGSPVHLSKALMDLISNAAEAMPEGGEIIVSTRNRYLDKPVKGHDDVRAGNYVTLTVSDAGDGMLPVDMERIFEPFYTKKVMGRGGTGLGMAVVWGTVKDHKGYIDIRAEKGRGTSFTLYFPITDQGAAAAAPDIAASDFRGRGETIVAADDVEEQRIILSTMLKRLGYSVKTFPGGEEAVEHLKTHSADLLILDMIMDPGIDGLETYKRVIEHHPGQNAIIVSGYSETERVREAQRLGVGALVKKPYILKTIARAIRNALDAGRRGEGEG